jgi:hypothetical protein
MQRLPQGSTKGIAHGTAYHTSHVPIWQIILIGCETIYSSSCLGCEPWLELISLPLLEYARREASSPQNTTTGYELFLGLSCIQAATGVIYPAAIEFCAVF